MDPDDQAIAAAVQQRRQAAAAAVSAANVDESVIDPALRRKSPDSSTSPDELEGSANGEDRPRAPPPNPASSFPPPTVFTAEMGRQMIRGAELSHRAGMEAESFLTSTNPVAHSFRSLIIILQIWDMLCLLRAEQIAAYAAPETLVKALNDYSIAWFYAPGLFSYRSNAMSSAVIRLMQQLNVSDMPLPHDTGRMGVLSRIVDNRLTQVRFHAKQVLVADYKKASLAGKSLAEIQLLPAKDKTNIADLTKAILVKEAKYVKPTLALYWRVAFLRAATRKFFASDTNNRDFWIFIDGRLEHNRGLYKSSADQRFAFESIYDADVSNFGPPSSSVHLMAAKDVSGWVATANLMASEELELVRLPDAAGEDPAPIIEQPDVD